MPDARQFRDGLVLVGPPHREFPLLQTNLHPQCIRGRLMVKPIDTWLRGGFWTAVMTSREYLYHLPCESSARKLDRFGSGWLAPETAVRTFCVVVPPPAFRHDLRFLERIEQLAVEKLLPHLAITQ